MMHAKTGVLTNIQNIVSIKYIKKQDILVPVVVI